MNIDGRGGGTPWPSNEDTRAKGCARMLRPNVLTESTAQNDELSEMLRVQFDVREMHAFFDGFAEAMLPDWFGSTKPRTLGGKPEQERFWADRAA